MLTLNDFKQIHTVRGSISTLIKPQYFYPASACFQLYLCLKQQTYDSLPSARYKRAALDGSIHLCLSSCPQRAPLEGALLTQAQASILLPNPLCCDPHFEQSPCIPLCAIKSSDIVTKYCKYCNLVFQILSISTRIFFTITDDFLFQVLCIRSV